MSTTKPKPRRTAKSIVHTFADFPLDGAGATGLAIPCPAGAVAIGLNPDSDSSAQLLVGIDQPDSHSLVHGEVYVHGSPFTVLWARLAPGLAQDATKSLVVDFFFDPDQARYQRKLPPTTADVTSYVPHPKVNVTTAGQLLIAGTPGLRLGFLGVAEKSATANTNPSGGGGGTLGAVLNFYAGANNTGNFIRPFQLAPCESAGQMFPDVDISAGLYVEVVSAGTKNVDVAFHTKTVVQT